MSPSHPRAGRTRRTLVLLTAAVAAATVVALPPSTAGAATAAATPVRVVVELTTPATSAALSADQRQTLRTRAARGNRGDASRVDGSTAARETAATTALGSARSAARSAQADVLAAARAKGIALTATSSAVDLLDAVFAEVAPGDLAALAALPGVARVTRDVTMQASTTPLPANAPASPTTPTVPTVPDAPTAPAAASDGRGTVIAVVDTGIDYTLADLGAGFGAGHKVVAGKDFVNDDADPMDDNAHGTHVAGIAAGTGANRITGAAPAARLTAWKVLGADGTGTTADVVHGIEAAVDPTGAFPADVVNLSLGGPGDGGDPVSRAAAAAAADGVVVVAAAGNSGPGEMTVGVPAASPSVLAVGASTTGLRLATARVVGATRDLPTWRVPWSANAAATALRARVVDVGDGTPADYDAAGDVTGAIVSYRGYAPHSTAEYPGDSYAQAALAQQRGAVAAIARQPSDLPLPGEGGIGRVAAEPGVVAAAADGAAGAGGDYRFRRLVLLGMYDADRDQLFGATGTGTVSVRLQPVVVAGQIASFSSRGPTASGALKPDLVAPGVEILSTVPHDFGIPDDVYRLSGTSMASPAVAGAAAVLRGREPGLTEAQVRARLIGSASRLPGAAATLPALTQGAGALDLPAALAERVTASPSTLSFGLAPGTGGTPHRRTVHLTNAGTAAVTARLTVAPGTGSQGTATVTPTSVRLAAGGSVDVVVAATSPADAGDSDLSGTVVAAVSDGSTVRLPFAQSTRSLLVRGNPQDTTGSTQVMVWSPMGLDQAPTVALRNEASGTQLTVPVQADGTAAGWYRGLVSLPVVGTYRVTATGQRGDAVLVGAATLSRIRPQSADTWQRLGRAGSAGELAVSTKAPGTAIQALPGSGRPFVTTDHGTTWTQVTSLPVGDGAGTPVADPSNGRAFWYALVGAPGQPPVDPTYQGRVLRTTDLGRTWTVLPFPDVHFRAFVGDGTVLAAVVDDGVQVSRDGGAHWDLVPFVWPETPTGATLVDGGLLVAGFSRVWRVAGIATATPRSPRAVVTGASGFMSIGAAGRTAAAASLDGTVRISTDAGLTWVTSTVPDGDFATGARVLGTEVFVGSNDGYWRSADAGTTWRSTPYPVFGPVGVDVERWPDRPRSLLMPLENAGLWASTDDGRTSRRIGVSGTTIAQVVTVPVAGGGSRVVVADEQGVGSLVMPAAGPVDETAWGLTGGEGRIGVAAADVAVDPTRPRSWTRIRSDASGNGGVERSTDAGATWTPVGPRTFGVSMRGLALDPQRSGHAAVAYTTLNETGVVVTDDDWATWRVQPYAGVVARQVVVDPATADRLWIAADDGLYRSDDDGRTVRRVLTGTVATVFVDPKRPRRVVVGGDVIRVSDDGGATFRRGTGIGSDVSIGSFAAVTATPAGASAPVRVLFAGSDALRPLGWPVAGRGVFRSTDGGLTWTSVAAGLQSPSVTSMAVTPDGVWLVVGTRSGGVHRAAVADLLR